jgi:hypothetical protein
MAKKEQKGYVSNFLHQFGTVVRASPSIAAHQHPSISEQHARSSTAANQQHAPTSAQLQVLLDASVCAAADTSLAEVFHRLEKLTSELLGTTTVRWLHVSQWHHMLFRYTEQDSCRLQGQPATAGTAPILRQHFVCNVGEGIAGAVALTGQPECIADCSVPSSATSFKQGSVVSGDSTHHHEV